MRQVSTRMMTRWSITWRMGTYQAIQRVRMEAADEILLLYDSTEPTRRRLPVGLRHGDRERRAMIGKESRPVHKPREGLRSGCRTTGQSPFPRTLAARATAHPSNITTRRTRYRTSATSDPPQLSLALSKWLSMYNNITTGDVAEAAPCQPPRLCLC